MIGTLRTTRLRPWVLAAIAPLVIGLSVQACSQDGPGAAAQGHLRKQVVSVSMTAAPIGQTSAGRAGLTPAVATFKPARPGRKVQIQAKVGKRWKAVTTAVQDKKGVVVFNVPGASKGKAVTYRVVAPKTSKDQTVVSKAVKSANWKLTWGDEFSGSGALGPKWQTRQAGVRAGLRLCSEVLEQNATKSGGSANLVVNKLPGATGQCHDTEGAPREQYGNAMVGALDPAYEFKYGFAAARVKFQSQRGQHSAFWLQIPDSGAPVPGNIGATGTEIDIAEYFGDARPKGGLAHFVHWTDVNGDSASVGSEIDNTKLLPKGKEWSDAWHVYSVEWTPKEYIFRVDGNIVMRTTKAVSQRTENVILSALTSDWETPQLKPATLPSVTKYDWVRVWQRPGS